MTIFAAYTATVLEASRQAPSSVAASKPTQRKPGLALLGNALKRVNRPLVPQWITFRSAIGWKQSHGH